MDFHYLARAIFFKNGKVLLAHARGSEHTFLPGGHIEMGEPAENTLLRELQEELGWQAHIGRFIGAVEHTWQGYGEDNHEINLLFEVDSAEADPQVNPISCEEMLDFTWAAVDELDKYNLYPASIRECLRTWDSAYHGFWGRIQQDE